VKYKIFRISDALLLNIFSAGLKPLHEVVEGIPVDAKIVNVQHGWPNAIDILLQSDKFSENAEGEPIPFLNVTVRTFAPELTSI
jgi:hypothetical protein